MIRATADRLLGAVACILIVAATLRSINSKEVRTILATFEVAGAWLLHLSQILTRTRIFRSIFKSLAPQAELLRDNEEPITVLIYETESMEESPATSLRDEALHLDGVTASIFGLGQGFEGYGSKYAAVYSVLQKLSPDMLVVLSDGRDVLLNNPASTDKYLATAATEFRAAFQTLTANQPGAVVISAEAQCCVSALTHATPGGYYNADGSRNNRACSSGEADCLWDGDDKAEPWETFMKHVAIQRTNENYDDVYLNAGLMAGSARDLLRLIEQAVIGKDEDDQAVLTDFMYTHPESIVLDYGQTMFGNNRGGLLGGMEDGSSCTFALRDGDEHERLVHMKTMSSPMFVHSPGGFLQCHDDLAEKLGVKRVGKTTRRRLKKITCNNYRLGCLLDGDREWGN